MPNKLEAAEEALQLLRTTEERQKREIKAANGRGDREEARRLNGELRLTQQSIRAQLRLVERLKQQGKHRK